MSRFTRAAATMHTLSLASMEEASRFGVRDADIDHLLLAIAIDPDIGGQILREMGVGLDAARTAVSEQHAAQLQLVGLASGDSGPGRITFQETSGYKWTDRALTVLKKASSGRQRGDSAAVLRALVDEPSGLIEAILRRLNVDPALVRSRLDEVQRLLPPTSSTAHEEMNLSGSRSIFVPASPPAVWELLSSPARIPEWDQSIARVDSANPAADSWTAETLTMAPDGKPIRVKQDFRRQRVELVEQEQHSHITWRFSHPESSRSNPRVIAFVIEHAAGGTQLQVTITFDTSRRRRTLARRVLRIPMRPLYRFAFFIQLAQLESSIGRVFR